MLIRYTYIRKDMVEKLALYEQHGVKEYWLILPKEQGISVYQLDESNSYSKHDVYTPETHESVGVGVLAGLASCTSPSVRRRNI